MNSSTLKRELIRPIMLISLAMFSIPAAADRLHLSEECEIAVAKSALPKRLREDVSVYALRDGEYHKVVEGNGPFTCIIERNHPDSVIPQCMDREGVHTVLPAIIDRSEMLAGGADFQSIEAANEKKLHAGHYQSASKPGVNYMMSDYNYIYVNSAEKVMKVPPHVMFYAPNVTNADIGGSFRSLNGNLGTPFVLEEGPHGYILTYAEHSADPNEVALACDGALGQRPPGFNPFSEG